MRFAVIVSLLFLSPVLSNAQTLPNGLCKALGDERAKLPPDLSSVCKPAANPRCPIGKMLNDIAFKFGMQVSGKTSGNRVVSPVGHIAGDVLGYAATKSYWDVLTDWETTAGLNCRDGSKPKGTITSSSRPWRQPIDTAPPCNCAPEKAKIKELEAKILNLENELSSIKGSLTTCNNNLAVCVTDLELCKAAQPLPDCSKCEAPFLWFTLECKPK